MCSMKALYALNLFNRGSVRDQGLDSFIAVSGSDLPAVWTFLQVHRLGFVAVLVDVFHSHPRFQIADLLRIGDGNALDRGIRVFQVFSETGFGGLCQRLPE